MRSRRGGPPLLLLAALGLVGGVLAAAALSAPRVLEVSPPRTGAGPAPALTSISITFSQEMQTASVEERFRLEPARPGGFRWDGRRMIFTPSQPWGEGETVRVQLAAGARSRRGLPMPAGIAWSFTVGAGRLAYLWPAGAPADIYLWAPGVAEPERLTQTPDGIVDFTLGPDGVSLLITRQEGTATEFVRLRLADGRQETLHRCDGPAACRSPKLSPDGQTLVYLQDEPAIDGSTLRRVMGLDLQGGMSYPLAEDDHHTSQPAWSTLGWLALYDHTLGAYAVYDRVAAGEARRVLLVPNALGELPVWSPDGEHVVLAEIAFLPEIESGEDEERPPRFYSHLIRISVRDGAQLDLSGDESMLVEDSGPAYAPDGAWIAFSRRSLDPASWSLGRQIWRMRPDGIGAEPLTSDAELNHAGLAWSPDGSRLAYLVFDQLNPTDPSAIWWRDLEGEDGGQIVVGGYAPQWIP